MNLDKVKEELAWKASGLIESEIEYYQLNPKYLSDTHQSRIDATKEALDLFLNHLLQSDVEWDEGEAWKEAKQYAIEHDGEEPTIGTTHSFEVNKRELWEATRNDYFFGLKAGVEKSKAQIAALKNRIEELEAKYGS